MRSGGRANFGGANQSASGRCQDEAGNQSALATATGINIDKTPPTAVASASPPANANGWRRTNVNVSFSGVDALSGVVSCNSAVIIAAGTNWGASGYCWDAAGNQSAVATITGINIDKTDPTITIASPANGAVYNRNQVVTANFICGDALSGVATCSGELANGQRLDTSKKVNNGKFTVNAVDKAGNSTKVTVSYSVK